MVKHAHPPEKTRSVMGRPRGSTKRIARGDELIRGVVSENEAFTAEAFCVRLGISRQMLIGMRQRGLKARRDGKSLIRIHGRDYLEYLQSLPVAELDEEAASSDPPAASEEESALNQG